MNCIKFLSAACVLTCLVLAGIVGGLPAVSAAAEPAVVLQNRLAVYSDPVESRAPVNHLNQGEEVLTKVEIFDSQGLRWCDVLNKGDEAMLGFVRCEGLKVLRPEQPESWHAVPSQEEAVSPVTEPKNSSAAPKVNNPKGGSTGQLVPRYSGVERAPQ